MRIVLIGASGHGKVCAEIAELNGYDEILFLDDDREQKACTGYPVCGTADEFQKFLDRDTNFFVSIGNGVFRKRILKRLEGAGGKIATLVHPRSVVSRKAKIGEGSVIMAGAVINPECQIGSGVIVNTGSSIDHDSEVGAYSHIAVGAHLCGGVRIGENCWIGAGAVVSNYVSVCAECVVGAGAVVVKKIIEAGTYVGVPARKHE